ncbi:MAG: 3-oxoacyl-ACP reductase FabG [Pseudomonadota bacterium]
MSDSSERVALVTGASRGIGAAIALTLKAAGFDVYGSATSEGGAAAISDALGAQRGLVLRTDDPDSIKPALDAMAHPPVVLVNNAGITRDNLILRMSEDEWTSVLNTNLSGVYRVSKAVLRGMMKARWGRIINIGSVVGRMGNAGQANYAASKAGLEGLTRALAQEVASRNITVNAVAPGFIETDMTAALTDEQRALMLDRIPLGRMGQCDEVGALIAFLAGDSAGYITGETIQINGGMYSG